MQQINQSLVKEIRQKFCNVEKCPISGDRIFFENAGGALTLRSAVETSTKFAAIPDNQGRDNLTSNTLNSIIKNAKNDLSYLFNTHSGEFFMGESGTELLFRLIRNSLLASPSGGSIVGTSLEHPASRSAAKNGLMRWTIPIAACRITWKWVQSTRKHMPITFLKLLASLRLCMHHPSQAWVHKLEKYQKSSARRPHWHL